MCSTYLKGVSIKTYIIINLHLDLVNKVTQDFKLLSIKLSMRTSNESEANIIPKIQTRPSEATFTNPIGRGCLRSQSSCANIIFRALAIDQRSN